MISFGEQKEKARIKNVCRAMNISATESNEITKDIEGARKQSKYKELFEKVDAIGDVIESASSNPCGFLKLVSLKPKSFAFLATPSIDSVGT